MARNSRPLLRGRRLLGWSAAGLLAVGPLAAQGVSHAVAGGSSTAASFEPAKVLPQPLPLAARRAEAAVAPAGKRYRPLPLPEFSPARIVPNAMARSAAVTHDPKSKETRTFVVPQNANPGRGSGFSPPSRLGAGSQEPQVLPSAFGDLSVIADPGPHPWRENVKIFFSNANGSFVCSGTLIHPRYVLTAGHCVFDHENGVGWADSMTVVPAYSNGNQPYGESEALSFTSFTGWTVSQDFDFDLAIVELDRPVGSLAGWFGYGWNSDNNFFSGLTMNNSSYPAETPYNGQELNFRSGTFDSIATELFEHNNPSYGGQSGSSSYRIEGADDRIVHSVVSYHRNGRTITGQPRITQTKFDAFEAEIATTVPAAPDLQILDSNATPAALAPGDPLGTADFLVFNNSGAEWTGEVSFDLYLSTNTGITNGDTYLQTRSWTGTIAPQGSIRLNANAGPPAVPAGTAAGNYFLGAILTVADSDTANNATRPDDTAPLQVTGGGGAPANDNWEDAISLADAPVTAGGSNVNATTEAGEPDLGEPGATVWWYYEGQGAGTLTVDTFGSDFDTILHIYEGFENGLGLAGLSLVASDDDSGAGVQSQVSFPVTGGKYYEIRVAGYLSDQGNIVLNAQFTPGVSQPAIAVKGNNQPIISGDITPAPADGTGFGQVLVGNAPTHTFVITNEGNAPLQLTGMPVVQVAGPGAFTISPLPAATIQAGTSASFGVRYQPAAPGAEQAVVSIASDDPARPLFTFTVGGEGVPNEGTVSGLVWQDLDGNGSQGAEPPLAGVTVFLDLDENGVRDGGEPFQISAADGSYAFAGRLPGVYHVRCEPAAGQVQTAPGAAGGSVFPPQMLAAQAGMKVKVPLTFTGSRAKTFKMGQRTSVPGGGLQTLDLEVNSVINLDDFRADPRFAGIDGTGWAVAILDTGMDLDHPAFGPDADGNGVADRIVYQHDYVNNDANASDDDDHGSNVASIAAGSSPSLLGVAPGSDIINLKVLGPSGGSFSMLESALQWVAGNAGGYQIASINMSLGDGSNFSSAQSLYGISDEIAAIAALDVGVVSASGNSFFEFASAQGVSYPAADANSMSIGASFDANIGSISWSGPTAFSSGIDRIAPFSQRHLTLTTIFAPGALSSGASKDGGVTNFTGTSQASPVIAGACVLAQQLAARELGRRLTQPELISLMRSSAATINDGDDEDDNVTNTGLNFPRVDVFAMGEAILAMSSGAPPYGWLATIAAGKITTGADFGLQTAPAPVINSPLVAGGYRDEPFSYQITATQGATAFAIAGEPLGMSVNALTGEITWTPAAGGSFPVTIIATNDGGSDSETLNITISPSTAIQAALESPLDFTQGADRWFLQSAESHDGSDALRSAAIGHGGLSYFETVVTPGSGGDNVSFWWKVSSEAGFDVLRFLVDGVQVAQISGVAGWSEVTHALAGGAPRTLRWEYSKNGSNSAGADAGFIDQLTLVPTGAFDVLVTTAADEQNGSLNPALGSGTSLREAVAHALAGQTIGFSPALGGQTLALSSGQMLVTKDLAIDASSLPGGFTVTGGGSTRHLEIQSGKTLSLTGLSFANGANSGDGGSIRNAGTLNLTDCSFSANSVGDDGGAIYNLGTLTLSGCALAGNQATSSGGAIGNLGTLGLTGCTFTANTATNSGGGIYNDDGSVTLESCTLTGNHSAGGSSGGAIDNDNGGIVTGSRCTFTANTADFNAACIDNDGTLTLTACTLSGNTADVGGGAIQNISGVLTLTSCTLTGNTAAFGGAIDGDGSSTIRLYSCTLTGNHATDKGGAIEETSGTLLLENTIVAGNTAVNTGPDILGSSINTQAGVNLMSTTSGLGGSFSGIVAAPNLAPLGDHGGPTFTMPPLPGSPAIDAGGATLLTLDQRGLPRVFGSAIDIGAVEIQGASLIVTTTADSGAGSLREIVAGAGAGATLTFAPSLDNATILLTTGPVVLDKSLSLDASDRVNLAVSAGGSSDVFQITAGDTVQILKLAIKDGIAGSGGLVSNAGTLTLANCILSGGSALEGGALFNAAGAVADLGDCRFSGSVGTYGGAAYNAGSMTLLRTVMHGNECDEEGGALFNSNTGILTATDSVFHHNGSNLFAGAIRSDGSISLTRSTVENNSAADNGGGLSISGAGGSMDSCTISGNICAGSGGGIVHSAGTLSLANCTIEGNVAEADSGGGIDCSAVLDLSSCTIAGNDAVIEGGGIYVHASGQLTLRNSIVAGNTAGSGAPDLRGAIQTQAGVNLLGSAAGVTVAFTGLVENPKLAPLGDYGGLTKVMPPLPGSPVIEAAIGGPATDQLGNPRPGGPLPDIGAVEALPFSSLDLADIDSDGIPDLLEPALGLTVGIDDSDQDSDGDGSPDAEEIASMTDPLDATDFLRILTFAQAPGFDPATNRAFTVSFPTFPGLTYAVEADQDLDFAGPEHQILIAPFVATGHVANFEVTLRAGHDFVRARRD